MKTNTDQIQEEPGPPEAQLTEDSSNLILTCLLEGLPLNLASRGQQSCDSSASSASQFLTESSRQECFIHPSSVLHVSMQHMFKREQANKFHTLHQQQINAARGSNHLCNRIIFTEMI